MEEIEFVVSEKVDPGDWTNFRDEALEFQRHPSTRLAKQETALGVYDQVESIAESISDKL